MRVFNFKPHVDEMDKNRLASQIFDLDSDRPGIQKSKRTEIREVITQIEVAQQAVNRVVQRVNPLEENKESSSYSQMPVQQETQEVNSNRSSSYDSAI